MSKKEDCTESLANVIFSTGIIRVYNNVCRKYFSNSVEKLKDDDATKMAYSLRLETTIFFLPFPICFISLASSLPLFFHPSVSSYLSLLSRSPSILSSFDFSTPSWTFLIGIFWFTRSLDFRLSRLLISHTSIPFTALLMTFHYSAPMMTSEAH